MNLGVDALLFASARSSTLVLFRRFVLYLSLILIINKHWLGVFYVQGGVFLSLGQTSDNTDKSPTLVNRRDPPCVFAGWEPSETDVQSL